MKVEFKQNGFSADMNCDFEPTPNDRGKEFKLPLKYSKALILGIIAVIISMANLPFGLFINLSADIMGVFLDRAITHWIIVLFILSVITLTVSVLCGVFSVISYARSKKRSLDNIGLILSILSFAVSATCLVLNAVGFILW